MHTKSPPRIVFSILLFVFSLMLLPGTSLATGKYSLYVARLIPHNTDPDGFTKPRWGGGVAVIVPISAAHKFLAVTIGLDYFNFYRETNDYSDPSIGRISIQTSQGYYRFYLGGRVGPKGTGFFHPFIGSNLSLVVYEIGTDFVTYMPQETGQREIRQSIDSQTKTVLGYDLNLGTELKVARSFIFECGARYLNSFNVPTHLDDPRSITVQSNYLQTYFSVGASFHT